MLRDSFHLQNPPFHIFCCIANRGHRFEVFPLVFRAYRCSRFHYRILPIARDTSVGCCLSLSMVFDNICMVSSKTGGFDSVRISLVAIY